MKEKTVPVSKVPETLVTQLHALITETKSRVPDPARRAIDRSALCRLAIQDFVDRYEGKPSELANRLGLQASPDGD